MLACLILFMITGMKILLQTLELKRGAYGIDEPITVLQVGTPFVPPNHVISFTEVNITESYREQEEKAGATTATTAPDSYVGAPDPIETAMYESPESSATQQDLEKYPSEQETEKQSEAYETSGSTASTMKSTRWLPSMSLLGRLRPGRLSWDGPRAVHALRAAEAYAKVSILVSLSLLFIHVRFAHSAAQAKTLF